MAKHEIDPDVFRQDVSVDPNDLNRCFVEHAGLFAHYAAIQVAAMRAEASARTRMEVIEAKTSLEVRNKAVEDKVKVTEAMIDQAVTLNSEVMKARIAYNTAKAHTQLAHHAVEAFRQRRDMLIQLGASYREEMKGAVSTRMPAESAGQRAIDALRSN